MEDDKYTEVKIRKYLLGFMLWILYLGTGKALISSNKNQEFQAILAACA